MSKRINLTVSEEQYELWKEEADRQGMNLPSFVRKCVSVYITAVLNKRKKLRK